VTPSSRGVRFLAVGWLGFLVQAATLWILTSFARWPWLPATCAAVEASIVHNYTWHVRWTWRDRAAQTTIATRAVRFLKYNVATGVVAIVGNVALTAVYLALLRVPTVAANAIAVVTLAVVNFLLADRILVPRLSAVIAAALCLCSGTASAQPSSETIQAWDRYVAQAEARIERARGVNAPPSTEVTGETIDVPSGAIHHWRGSVFVPGVTLDRMIGSLLRGACPSDVPGCGAEPHMSNNVAESRTLSRSGDTVRTYIRLVRRSIVTVSYDTEHEMTFRRWTPTLATARSVAMSIREVGGADHGFLWRLNSYWRYRQVAGGVIVELESITLSRSIPGVVRPVALPIVQHIARESMAPTLDAFRARFES